MFCETFSGPVRLELSTSPLTALLLHAIEVLVALHNAVSFCQQALVSSRQHRLATAVELLDDISYDSKGLFRWSGRGGRFCVHEDIPATYLLHMLQTGTQKVLIVHAMFIVVTTAASEHAQWSGLGTWQLACSQLPPLAYLHPRLEHAARRCMRGIPCCVFVGR